MAKLYGSVNGQSKEVKALYGSVNGESKEITKLYGSVNGESKLIYEKDTGLQYGVVYYRPSVNDATVLSVELKSEAEFNSLCPTVGTDPVWYATVGNGTVTLSNMSTNIILGIEIGNKITTIGNNFMFDCPYFNQPLTIPSTITSIGTAFLAHCHAMVSEINVGSLDAAIAAIGTSDRSFTAYSNSSPAYATGIPIAGQNRAAWLARFPNKASFKDGHRKLLDAGH